MSWIVSGTNLDGSTKTCLLLVSNSSEYLAEQKKVVASSFWNVVIGDRVAFLKIERKHLWIYNDIYIYMDTKIRNINSNVPDHMFYH